MPLRQTIVRWFDTHAPGIIGSARYRYHVSLRGDLVHPRITGPLFQRLDSRAASAIDVGANVGIYTRYLCSRFASVVAVEPVPYLAERLVRSKLARCRVEAVALGEASGEVSLRVPVNEAGMEMPALSTASEANALAFIRHDHIVEHVVPCRRLDDIARTMERLAFVKIDVEGYEGAVIAGADEMLANIRPAIQLEIGRAHNPNYRQVLERLDQAGFEAFAMHTDGLYRDVDRFLNSQPLKVSDEEATSPQGCWDYLFLPKERALALSAGLVRD